MKSLILFLVLGLFSPVAFAQTSTSWHILKTSWSASDEKNFQSFVQQIGEAVAEHRCRKVIDCITSSANPYHNSDPAGLRYTSDCADFPYFLRGYFAWKNGLPFSLATSMNRRDVPNNGSDIRYTPFGNVVAKKFDVVAKGGKFPSALQILNSTIPDEADSSNYRFYYKGNDTGALFVDFYPVKLTREAVSVGTVLYDPNGHVATIYKVSDDGKLYYVDAHPDNSLTSGIFNVKFVRANPGQGAGFKNWRPVKLVGATKDANGYWINGQIQGVPNAQLPLYGVDQFFGTGATHDDLTWSKGKFVYNGQEVTYYDYIRFKVAKGDLKIDPLNDFRESIGDLCESLQDRVVSVDLALKAGIQSKEHPARLPENIYGTEGEWESYSTPSRDARLKVSFRDLIDQVDSNMRKLAAHDPSVVYAGSNLPQDLLDIYHAESVRCQMVYTNSAGAGVTLNLADLTHRLYRLSFDPYHCVEARWGATGDELASCQDDQTKRLWYDREQRLRNQSDRRYDVKMGFSLDDLAQPTPNNGIATGADVDVEKYLMSLHR